MTIKPIANQKSNEKKENHGHNHQESSQQNIVTNSRPNRNKSSVEVQSSQLRNDVYEDITRHRRSPHKLLGRSKREHHKRGGEQRDREKCCSSPQYVQSHSTNLNTNSLQTTVNNNQSGKSPKHITTTSPTQLQQQTHQQPNVHNLEEQYSGYNSGDEHLVPGETLLTPDEWKNRDEQFVKAMSERGFIIQDIVEDGACLFRAISLQIYGDQEMHEVIRQQTMDYIHQNREYFAHFVTEDINNYVKRKRNKDSHGNHIEIQAMSEIYNRPVELYCYQTTPINIFNSEQINNGYDPLRLSYQRGSHYNAILDPYNASVGVGLGLSGYKPESQTREAIRLSEQLEIEKTMFEDKLKTTDWEATNEAIEEQIARESYLQWCRENMQKATCNSNTNKLSQSCTSSTVTSAEAQNINNNNISSSNTANCETIASASCILNDSPSSLKEFHNNNNNSNSSNNTNNSNSTNNPDSHCDREQISDQQQNSMLSKALLKKQDGSFSGSGISCCNNNNSGNNTVLNECNSPCDSDDTDMSSTSSIDQYQHYRLKSSIKQYIKSPRLLKRRHKGYELKRNSIEVNDPDFSVKRSKQCLETFQHQQQHKNTVENCNYLESNTTATTTTAIAKTKVDNVHNSDLLPCTSKQAEADNKPVSKFYQSLLESSYTEDGLGQLSENEMLQKAIAVSRMDFIEEQKRKFSSEIYNNDDDGKSNAADEDSDTLST